MSRFWGGVCVGALSQGVCPSRSLPVWDFRLTHHTITSPTIGNLKKEKSCRECNTVIPVVEISPKTVAVQLTWLAEFIRSNFLFMISLSLS